MFSHIPLWILSFLIAGVVLWHILNTAFTLQGEQLFSLTKKDLNIHAQYTHQIVAQTFSNILANMNRAVSHLIARPDFKTFMEKSQSEPLNLILKRFIEINHLDYVLAFDSYGVLLATSSEEINDIKVEELIQGSALKHDIQQRLDSTDPDMQEIFKGNLSYKKSLGNFQKGFTRDLIKNLYGPVVVYQVMDDFGDKLGWVISGRFLQHSIKEIEEASHITGAAFISFIDGNPQFNVGFSPAPPQLTPRQMDAILKENTPNIIYGDGEQEYLLHCVPFYGYDNRMISIHCTGFPLAPALANAEKVKAIGEKAHHTARAALILIALITLVIMIIVSLIVTHRITKPINLITQSMTRLSNDDTDLYVPLAIDSIELQRLADAMVVFRNNITQRLEMEETLRLTIEDLKVAKAKAETSELAKSEFLSKMSHELRTPLNAIIGFSKFVAEDFKDDPKNSKYLGFILDNGNHLLRMVQDLLDIAQSVDGRMHLNEAPLDMNTVIDLAYIQVLPDARKKGVRLEPNANRKLPIIWGDGDRLRQVFRNILENAVKFTPENGRVEIKAFIQDDGQLAVIVSDTGIGLDPKACEAVFTLFWQADSSSSRAYGGIGMGLHLAKAMVELHAGIITMDSEKEKGTTVTVRLPAERIVKKEP